MILSTEDAAQSAELAERLRAASAGLQRMAEAFRPAVEQAAASLRKVGVR